MDSSVVFRILINPSGGGGAARAAGGGQRQVKHSLFPRAGHQLNSPFRITKLFGIFDVTICISTQQPGVLLIVVFSFVSGFSRY